MDGFETVTGYLRSLESTARARRYMDRERDLIRRSHVRSVAKATPLVSSDGLQRISKATSMDLEAVVQQRSGKEKEMRGDFLMTEVKARQADLLREAEEYRRFAKSKRDEDEEFVPIGRTKAYFYRKALSAAAIALVLSIVATGAGI
ncbi:MAG: hypothetical protein ACLGHL_06235 [Actinomycetota bacterium]